MAPLVLLALSIWSGVGCIAGGTAAMGESLEDTEWVLKTIVVQGNEQSVAEKAVITMKVGGGRVEGKGPVNGYSGSAALTQAGGIEWRSAIRATRRAGPPDLMRLESEYLAALPKATVWRRAGEAGELLELSNSDESTRLIFKRAGADTDL